jgi:hypothetical protein
MLEGQNPAKMTFTAVDQVSPSNIGTGNRTLRVIGELGGSVVIVEISQDGIEWSPDGTEGAIREYTAFGNYPVTLNGLYHVRTKCTTYVSTFKTEISCN